MVFQALFTDINYLQRELTSTGVYVTGESAPRGIMVSQTSWKCQIDRKRFKYWNYAA